MKMDALWPTMFGSGNFEVEGLVEYIFSNYDLSSRPGVDGNSIFADKHSTMEKFKKVVYNKFDEYLINTIGKRISDYDSYEMKAWITGHGKYYSMSNHNHSGSQLSGVFYIMVEEKDVGGEIVFSDPRSNCNRGYDDWFFSLFQNHIHAPKTGDYMIFPSFAYHCVNPYLSSLRICIPVDLYLHRQ